MKQLPSTMPGIDNVSEHFKPVFPLLGLILRVAVAAPFQEVSHFSYLFGSHKLPPVWVGEDGCRSRWIALFTCAIVRAA